MEGKTSPWTPWCLGLYSVDLPLEAGPARLSPQDLSALQAPDDELREEDPAPGAKVPRKVDGDGHSDRRHFQYLRLVIRVRLIGDGMRHAKGQVYRLGETEYLDLVEVEGGSVTAGKVALYHDSRHQTNPIRFYHRL